MTRSGGKRRAERKRRVLFIGTGGTISAVNHRDGIKPQYSAAELLARFPRALQIADILPLDLAHIDSANVHPRNWTEIADHILGCIDQFDGVVIGHGTDTMAYSAAALSFCLGAAGKPVVLTGASLPPDDPASDAERNFQDAVAVAASELVSDVCIVFHGEIIKGTHARKMFNEASTFLDRTFKLFRSINAPRIGHIDTDLKIYINSEYGRFLQSKSNTKLINTIFCPSISLIKIFPGMDCPPLDAIKCKKAIVIEGFGPGNIPYDYSNWIPTIKNLRELHIPTFICSQNPFGSTDLLSYEPGRLAHEAGAVSCGAMSLESALCKLMWIFGDTSHAIDIDRVTALFNKNLVGEFHGIKASKSDERSKTG